MDTDNSSIVGPHLRNIRRRLSFSDDPQQQQQEQQQQQLMDTAGSGDLQQDTVIQVHEDVENAVSSFEEHNRLQHPGNFDDGGQVDTASEIAFALRSEEVRRRTFLRRWSDAYHASPFDLARAGMFYFNRTDHVQCIFCLTIFGRWEEGDCPMSEHTRLSPRCPFMLGLPVGNIPLSLQANNNRPPSFPQTAVTNTAVSGFPMVTRHTSAFDAMMAGIAYGRSLKNHQRNLNVSWSAVKEERLSNQSTISTKLDGYVLQCSELGKLAEFHHRCATFSKWPVSTGLTGIDMAGAGFFFTEISDQVACVQCGLHLRGWQSHHVPLEEHSKWRDTCPFIKGLSNVCLPALRQSNDVSQELRSIPLTRVDKKSKKPIGGESFECKICFERNCEFVIIPCAHMCACLECGLGMKKCPICRGPIKTIVKVYT